MLLQAIEIFATVSGLLYVILEIRQKNAMWWVGIATGAACAWMFLQQRLWASAGLNMYYMAISVWGLWQWRRDRDALNAKAVTDTQGDRIHLRRPGASVWAASAALTVLGSIALALLLKVLDDPSSALDAVITVLSAVATWWLARSYRAQWLLWILADLLSATLCFRQGLYAMTALYLGYTASAVYGWFYWGKRGEILS